MVKDTSAFDEGEAVAAPSLASLMKLAARAEELEATVADLEAALKEQKSALTFIKTQQLPDAMVEAGVTKLTSASGAELKLSDFVTGSLPKEPEKRNAALAQLVKEGGTDLIKNNVVVAFTRSQHNAAAALADDLRKMGHTAEMISDVNHMQLTAFVREKLRNGEEVAYEKLGCFVGRVVKIELP